MRPLFLSALALVASTNFASADANAVDVCLFEETDWATTLAACNDALTASTDPVEQGRFILHRGLAHEHLGDLEAARLDQILVGQYRPDWFRGFANAASLSHDMGDTEGQERWAQAAIDAEPDNPRAYYEMLFLLVNDSDPESCLPVAEQIASLLPHPIDWAFNVTRDEYLMGDLGYCFSQNEQPERAMRALLAADHMGLEEAWLYTEIAYLAYAQLEQYDRAAHYAMLALEVGDRNIYDADTLIYSYVYLGDVDAALATATEYADLLDVQEQEWGTRNIVGWTLFIQGRLDEASTVMEAWADWAMAEIEQSRPTAGYVWDTVAHIRAGLGDTEGAIEAFRMAFEFDDDREAVRELYRHELTQAGFDPGEGDAGIISALEACAATGPACRLIPDEDE